MNRLTFIALLPLVVLAACDQAPVPVPTPTASKSADPDAALEEVEKAMASQVAAIQSGDVDKAVSVYAPDATLIVPGQPPLDTLEGIRSTYVSMMGVNGHSYELKPRQTWVSGGGDFAVVSSAFTYAHPGSDTTERLTLRGRRQTVWQKQPNGIWKIVSDYAARLPDPAENGENAAEDADKSDARESAKALPHSVPSPAPSTPTPSPSGKKS